MKKTTLAIVTAALTMTLSVPVFASARINIKANPTDEFRRPGETALFIAEADAYDRLEWVFADRNGNEYTISEVKTMFPGLEIQGEKDTYFRVGNLPEEMNGWDVYCRFIKGGDEVITDEAMIHVGNYAQAEKTDAAPQEAESSRPTAVYAEQESPVEEPEADYAYTWYDEDGNLNRVISREGVVETEYYDGSCRYEYPDGLVVFEDADGTLTQYDEEGNFQEYDPDGGYYIYDAATDTVECGNYYY